MLQEDHDLDLDGVVDTTTSYEYDHTQQTGKSIFDNTTGRYTTQSAFTYDAQGRMETMTTTEFSADGIPSRIEQTRYDYDEAGIRISAESQIDVNADGTWDETTRTEFLSDHFNFTGYSQVIKETTFDTSGDMTKTIEYVFGHDEVTQTVTEFDDNGDVSSERTDTFGHDAVR